MRIAVNVGVRILKAGMRVQFVRGEDIAEGVFTIKSVDGCEITFVEPLPSGIQPDDWLIPECLVKDYMEMEPRRRA